MAGSSARVQPRCGAQRSNVGIRWNKRWVCVSHLLMEQHVGLEAIDDGLWNVYFGPIWLGWFVEAKHRIVDRKDRELRRP